ncbi:MAG: hypothetical protein OXI26_00025 [bacterium]|nr:hypothetical protein [bacterium]
MSPIFESPVSDDFQDLALPSDGPEVSYEEPSVQVTIERQSPPVERRQEVPVETAPVPQHPFLHDSTTQPALDPPMIIPIRAYYMTRADDTLRSVAAQFLNTPSRWQELRSLNAAYPGIADAEPDTVLPIGSSLALPGDPLPWGRPDPVYLWTLAEKFLYTAWGREPSPEEVVPFWRGLTSGAQHLDMGPAAPQALGESGEPLIKPPILPAAQPPGAPPEPEPAEPEAAEPVEPQPPAGVPEADAEVPLEPELAEPEVPEPVDPKPPADVPEVEAEALLEPELAEPEVPEPVDPEPPAVAPEVDPETPPEPDQPAAEVSSEEPAIEEPAPEEPAVGEPPVDLPDAVATDEPPPEPEQYAAAAQAPAPADALTIPGYEVPIPTPPVPTHEAPPPTSAAPPPVAPPPVAAPPPDVPTHEPQAPYRYEPPTTLAPGFEPVPRMPDLGPIEPPATVHEGGEDAPLPAFMPSLTGATPSAELPVEEVVASSQRALAGTAIGDAMMLWQLGRLRRRGSRRAGAEPDPLELSLEQTARMDSLRLIEAAMRHLRAVTVAQLKPKPRVVCVRVGTYGFEVLLDQPVEAPEGWQVATGGYVLELPRGITVEQLDAVGRGPSLCPALVPIGDTAEGPLLLNIEEIGCLAVSGPGNPTASLLTSIVETLGSSPLAGDIRIVTVGVSSPVGPGWERIHTTSFDSPQLEHLLSTAHSPGHSGAGSIDVLVVGPGNDLLFQRAGQIATTPGSRLVLVGATSSPAARWPWRVHVDEDSRAVVHPIAVNIVAMQAMRPELTYLLSDAADETHTTSRY